MKNVKTIACFVTLAVAASAWATDMAPPSWRGQAGTTFQAWDFDTDANPAAPTSSVNASGSASANVTVGMFGSGWLLQPLGGTVSGYWDIGEGSLALDIPGTPSAYQDVWVQVTYYQAISQAPIVTVPGAQFVSDQTLLYQADPPLGGWFVNQSLWRLEPSAGNFQILLSGDPMWGAVVDQVVVDTMVPEPTSILLAGVMAAGFVLRRTRA